MGNKWIVGGLVGLVIAVLFLTTLTGLTHNLANNLVMYQQAKSLETAGNAMSNMSWAMVISQCIWGAMLIFGTILSLAAGIGGTYIFMQWKAGRQPQFAGAYGGYPGFPRRSQQPRIQGLPAGAMLLSNNRLVMPDGQVFLLTHQEVRELALMRSQQGPSLPSGGNKNGVVSIQEPEPEQPGNMFSGWNGMS
jgi:hypothetical protein